MQQTMKNDRLRQPLSQDYAEALGRAMYCFAVCEWNVLWCSERVSPGRLRKLLAKPHTAGEIASKFKDITRNMPRSKDRERLKQLAAKFAMLVELRNGVVHGKPCYVPGQGNRLSAGRVLEIDDINAAADAFSECAIELNRELYGYLAERGPAEGHISDANPDEVR